MTRTPAGTDRGGRDARGESANCGGRVIVGIAGDVSEPRPGRNRLDCAVAYMTGIARAGAMPIVLPPIVDEIPSQLELCDAVVLTGGDDPRMEPFGKATHAASKPMHELRQAYDTALLMALEVRAERAVLGVCLGMQMMALLAGGDLDQCLPETRPSFAMHRGEIAGVGQSVDHELLIPEFASHSGSHWGLGKMAGYRGLVCSHHRQAVRDPGRLRVVAQSEDGVIEAIEDPRRRFYVGVQWHPERTMDVHLGQGVFDEFVRAAGELRELRRTAGGAIRL